MAQKTYAELAAQAAEIKDETTANANTATRVGTILEDINDSIVSREFNRTFVEALVFDKNEIFHAPYTQTGALNLTIDTGGLVDESSTMRFRITADGVSPINFGEGFDYLYGISNGQILSAGTYEIYFLYTNGSVSVNVPGVTAESSSLVVLASPANFVATANGENEIDLTWDNNTDASSYEIQFSSTGSSGPWIDLAQPAAGSTSYNHTGLSAGTTYHYRIRCIGDGISFTYSAYSVDATTTESSSDVTAPTFTFLPASGNIVWPINKVITITADEALRNTDGSDITNANVATRITLKETNSGGTNIAFTATIDTSKMVITITPTTIYGENQLVYVAINNVEDVNGNEVTVSVSSTFTTTEHTFFNGSSNFLKFGDILDSLFTPSNAEFRIKLTVNNVLISGTRVIVSKWDDPGASRSFMWYIQGSSGDVLIGWIQSNTGSRFIKWAGALTSGEHDLELRYDGSVATNNGLDRVTLLVDGVTAGSKTLVLASLALGTINPSSAQLAVGVTVNSAGNAANTNYFTEEGKDFILESGSGSVEEINVHLLKVGTDSSGNGRNGTWV